nr:MAG TPA: hypothetical protein [Caudoviricetes sp.]
MVSFPFCRLHPAIPSRSHLCGNFRSSSAYSSGFHGSSGSPEFTVPAHFCFRPGMLGLIG